MTVKMAKTDRCQQSEVVQHFNVCFKRGNLVNSIDARFMNALSFLQIEWVWCIEECRRATPEEIRRLCDDPEI